MRRFRASRRDVIGIRLATACLLSIWSLYGVCIHACVAQTISSSRSPVAAGTLVDNYPFTWTNVGDDVESQIVIGYQDNTIRKAVLEFDISDLKPGVVESARLTGQINPLQNTPSGTRQHNVHVNMGNGVIDVGDNNQTGTFHTGWFQHAAGASSVYNQTITRQFRYLQHRGADYLRQVIQPDDTPQGWDQVSLSPGPKLELQLRPTTASSEVFYQTPVAAAAAEAQGGGSFNVNNGATRMEVMNWNYPPFEQGRGLLEYDLSSIPRGASILWAKLDVHIDGLQGSTRPPYGPNLEIAGYFGNGIATTGDLFVGAQWLGNTGELRDVGVASWNISADFVKSVLVAGTHLGLRFQPGLQPEYRASIALRSSPYPEIRPHLAIAYEIPEPSTWVSLLTLVACMAVGSRWHQ